MPYCRKCGAKLADDARFCYVCGTQATPVPSQPKPATSVQTRPQVRRAGLPTAAIILIVILVLSLVAVFIVLLPFQPVEFSQSNEASAANVNLLRLTVSADTASINIMLRDLPGNQRAATTITATGWRGIFGTDEPLDLSFAERTEDTTLVYSVNVSRAEGWAVFDTLNVTCDVYVDSSVSLVITITTDTGTIMMNSDEEATFQNLVLRANTGSVEASLKEGTTIAGDFSLETITGSVQLLWDDAKFNGNVPVSVKAITGSVNVNINQTSQLGGNVTLNAEATTGSVNLAMKIENDIGAKISASTTLGGIDVEQEGFSGDEAPLQSNNYPAGSNFDVTLRATTGGININAVYELGGTRS